MKGLDTQNITGVYIHFIVMADGTETHKQPFSLRLPVDAVRKILTIAKAEYRTPSNVAAMLIEEALEARTKRNGRRK